MQRKGQKILFFLHHLTTQNWSNLPLRIFFILVDCFVRMELWTNILFFVAMLTSFPCCFSMPRQFTKWAARLLAVASDTVQNSIKSLFIYREKEFLQCNLLQVTLGSISSTFPNINCIFTLSWEISIGAMYTITLIFWCHMYSICKTHCFEIFEMKNYHYVPFPLNWYTHLCCYTLWSS